MEQLSFDQMHFHEILRSFIKNVSKIHVWLKLHRNSRQFTKDLCTFVTLFTNVTMVSNITSDFLVTNIP
jgi:hypothetical protein